MLAAGAVALQSLVLSGERSGQLIEGTLRAILLLDSLRLR